MKRTLALLIALVFLLVLLWGCGTNISRQSPAHARSHQSVEPVTWPDVSASATVKMEGSNDVALIVAIEDYTFLPDVPGATRNAEDWRNFLRNNVGVKTVYTLYDEQASREEMLRFARKAASEVGSKGRLWFVFVGHGAPSADGEGMLVGMDAQQTVDSLASRSAAQSELVANLQSGAAMDVVMVVDACFSGRDSGGSLLAKGSQPVVPVGALQVPSKVTVLSAAKANEFAGSLPNTERPAFSYLLLGAMRGWADDGDQVVRADEAVAWTRAQLGHVTGRTQTPNVHGNGSIALTSSASEADPGISELMRGRPRSAPVENSPAAETATESAYYDTGKGFRFVPPKGWTLFSSVPGDYYDPDLTTVTEHHHPQIDAMFRVNFVRYGGNSFVGNVKVMNNSFEDLGRMTQQRAVEIEGRSGIFQRWRLTKTEGGEPRASVVLYLKDGEDMWMIMSSSTIDRDDWLLAVNREVWSTITFD